MLARSLVIVLIAAAPSGRGSDLAAALKGEAKAQYEQARTLFGHQDFSGALARYREAYRLQPDPRLLFNLAVCEKQLRNYARALPLLDEFLARAGSVVAEEQLQEAAEFKRAVRALVGEITFECS